MGADSRRYQPESRNPGSRSRVYNSSCWGKFGGGGYKVSGGLHGVGASVVNALSIWLEVEIRIDGKIHKQRYERGQVCYPLKVIGTCDPDETLLDGLLFVVGFVLP